MINPLTLLVRSIALHRNASTSPTGIIPLDHVRRATVFLDGMESEAEMARESVLAFFRQHDIPVKVICPREWDINLFGWLKKEKVAKGSPAPEVWEEDLFISLCTEENFASEYASRCSRARFKVGRFPLSGEVYDLVISNPEHNLPRQAEVFEVMKEFLEKIK